MLSILYFIIMTDHKKLQQVKSAKMFNTHQAMWGFFFTLFNFTNINTDMDLRRLRLIPYLRSVRDPHTSEQPEASIPKLCFTVQVRTKRSNAPLVYCHGRLCAPVQGGGGHLLGQSPFGTPRYQPQLEASQEQILEEVTNKECFVMSCCSCSVPKLAHQDASLSASFSPLTFCLNNI